MFGVAVAQSLNQIGEQAGHGRVHLTRAAQFVAQVVGVDEVGQAIEVRIGQRIAG